MPARFSTESLQTGFHRRRPKEESGAEEMFGHVLRASAPMRDTLRLDFHAPVPNPVLRLTRLW